MRSKTFWVVATIGFWLAVRVVFWLGYGGADDMYYARYAYELDRPPINHWEFRIPAVAAIRASFAVFGPTEFAAALPTLLASAAIFASVAWFVGWPRQLNWQTQSSMLLAATVPLDAGMASYPGANLFSAGLLALGTLCVLKGTTRVAFLGALLLAIGFAAHEVSFFYVAIFCLTALAFDWRRFWKPVLACVLLSGGTVLAECAAYSALLDEPLARLKNAAAAGGGPIDYEMRFGDNAWRYFTWPLEMVLFCKHFGFGLLLLFGFGLFTWRRLETDQKLLLAVTFLYWFWLGYGTSVPWAYKPINRAFHYYFPLTLGIAALLPIVLGHAFSARKHIAWAIIGLVLAVHLANLSAGGRWGQAVDVSRDLLQHAEAHADQTFLADVNTMNEMYVLGGFQLPANVVCLNGPAVERHLLLNKQPEGRPKYEFPAKSITAILVNHERIEKPVEPEFRDYLGQHRGAERYRSPICYRLLFAPVIRWLGHRDFAVRSLGGEVVDVAPASP